MKKLFLGLLVFAFGASVYAAAAPWKVFVSGVMCGNDADAYNGLAYIIDAKTLSMASAFDHFTAATDPWGETQFEAASAGQINVANGLAIAKDFNYGTGGVYYNFYALILNGDEIYFSNLLNELPGSTSLTATQVQFAEQNNGTTTFSHKAANEGYKGTGYWQKAGGSPVPEPTSGMLLILGLSALALRRRRMA